MVAARRLFGGLTFKVADDPERERALEFRGRVYREALGDPGLDARDAGAVHLVGIDATGAIVAAMRLIEPAQRPFDLERFVALDALLPPEARPAELSRFCVDPSRRAVHRGQVVHLGMFKLVYEVARQRGLTDLLTLGLPNLQNLYKLAYFTPLGISVDHPTWGPAHVMRLNLAETRKLHGDSSHPIARLLFRTPAANVIV